MEDLQLMGVHGDAVTHTSDYFDKLYELAVQMIKSGKAYADDTEKEQVGHPTPNFSDILS
jgi:glutamyl-tRNA synthetase